jgi:hypothetical protein
LNEAKEGLDDGLVVAVALRANAHLDPDVAAALPKRSDT